jgi:hypothetical protein
VEAELSLQVQMFFAKTHESFSTYYMKRFTFSILLLCWWLFPYGDVLKIRVIVAHLYKRERRF